jgi:cation diffusion facilitator family transporter
MNPNRRKNLLGYVEGFAAIIINTALFVLKLWAGLQTASIAIIADAWHTLSDSFTSLVVILGFKISAMPADAKHPFGHGRAEIIASVIIGTLLAIVGFNFFVESLERFNSRQAASFNVYSIFIFIASILLKEGIAQFSFWAAKRIGSRSLRADAWHHRTDAIASLLILAGIYLGRFFWWIDSVLGMAVALLIFYASFDILKDSVSSLIGEEPDELFREKIATLVNRQAPCFIDLHHMHLHGYGDHKELTFHIKLPPDMALREAHKIADLLEKKIKAEMYIEATIHMDPWDAN